MADNIFYRSQTQISINPFDTSSMTISKMTPRKRRLFMRCPILLCLSLRMVTCKVEFNQYFDLTASSTKDRGTVLCGKGGIGS
jgi:hypothetical protein